jgi:hypothetical protein
MGARQAFAFAVACAAAMVFVDPPSHAQSAPTPMEADPNEPSGFEIAHGLSFYEYDACDDHQARRRSDRRPHVRRFI